MYSVIQFSKYSIINTSSIKHKALSISDKLNILKKYNEGLVEKKKQKDIANELGIPPSTLIFT
jgi:hypothetical protein